MTIAGSVVDDIVGHARECQPRECCGVLLGRAGHITQAIRARNAAESATRFELDARDHITARRIARDQQLEVLGFYHSHPQSRAYPSPTDLSEASYPECVHLIVGFAEGEPEVRVFRYAEGTASEIPLARS